MLLFLIIGNVSYQNANASQVIKATTLQYPPYEYIADDQAKGIAVDIIKEAFRRMGNYQVEFSFFPWGRSVHETKSGRQDLLFNAGINLERKTWGQYIDTVLIDQRYVLFTLAENNISVNKNIDNVQELSLGTKLHYIYGTGPLRAALDNNHFKQVFEVRAISQNVQMLLRKRIDLFVGDYLPVMHYLTTHCLLDKIRVIKETNTQDDLVVLHWPTYIVVSKKSSLLAESAKLNRILADMKQSGVFKQLAEPYYQFVTSTPSNQEDCVGK